METLKLLEPKLLNSNPELQTFSNDLTFALASDSKILEKKSINVDRNFFTSSESEYELLMKISEFEKSEYKWPLELLTDYINRTYYTYISGKSTEILIFTRRNYESEEELNPLIFNYNLHFLKLSKELNNHVKLREEITFPAIVQLLNAESFNENSKNYTLKEAIQEGYKNFEEIKKELKYLKKIRESFTYSGSLSSFYKKLNTLSLEFEKAVQFHLHLEISILYPEAIFLEEEAQIWK